MAVVIISGTVFGRDCDVARSFAEFQIIEYILSGTLVPAFHPEHELVAFEDRYGDGKRLHLVVQPELSYKDTICKHIELDRVLQRLLAPYVEYFICRIHIFRLIGDGERTALILSIWVERRR